MKKSGISQSEVLEFTELAAVATVGDVMDLQGENRIIVKRGPLRRLSVTHTPGLRALIRANQLEGAEITAYHVGFVLVRASMPADVLTQLQDHWNFV